MTILSFTYTDVAALRPCASSFTAATRKMGGVAKWKATSATFSDLYAAKVPFDDLVWLASALSLRDRDTERRLLLWLADCLAHIGDMIWSSDVRVIFDRCVASQRAFARSVGSEEAWKDAARAAWAAWDARASWTARAAWDARAAWAAWAAWDARAVWAAIESRDAGGAEPQWQTYRFLLWMSDQEPEDWPLPPVAR